VHELKILPDYFGAVSNGVKNFELRRNDRGFYEGDTLRLQEYSPSNNAFTGREIVARIKYVLESTVDFPVDGLKPGFAILSIETVMVETE
jgi:hypothetical protein